VTKILHNKYNITKVR